jgi:hypothetical protein
MPEQICFCGFRLNRIDQVLYYVDDAICCNAHCLHEATWGAEPIDRDGYLWGLPPEPQD